MGRSPNDKAHGSADEIGFIAAFTTYLAYATLVLLGHIRDTFGKLTGRSRYFGVNSRPPKGYAPLLQDWENFFTRRLFHRVQDCFSRPIEGPPKASCVKVLHRTSDDGNKTMNVTDATTGCVNLASYNYLGFADDWQETCRKDVLEVAENFPVGMGASFAEGGYTVLHQRLEREVAQFIGKEAAIVFNMGYATNFLGIPSVVGGKGCLIVSNTLNHNSIVNGARNSGATVRVFKHRDYAGLDSVLRQAIVEGQDRTHRPWRKIVVMVEGIYSMEGEIEDLAAVVEVAKRYKAYVYLDEAHSIGAMGKTGRGVTEHCGVSPDLVDVMMGTFTKSFGAMGGYIAGSQELIDALRSQCAGFLHDNAMPPVVCQQVLTALGVIQGKDGTTRGAEKIQRLKDNSNYFRKALIEMGCAVLGQEDSPIVPVMMYHPSKIAYFSRFALEHGIAVVIVGFPATPLLLARCRFCLSAGHTREDLDKALAVIAKLTKKLRLRYALTWG